MLFGDRHGNRNIQGNKNNPTSKMEIRKGRIKK